jgi:hypothetical protein
VASELEIIQTFKLLRDAYPYYKPDNPDGIMDIWVRKLGNTPAPVLKRAAEMHMEANKFFPSLAEMIENLKPAEYAVAQEEQHMAEDNSPERKHERELWAKIESLKERFYSLERAYHREQQLNLQEWMDLSREFEAIGWDYNAAYCLSRYETFKAMLEQAQVVHA